MVSLAELIAYVDHVIAQKQLEEEKQLAYWKNMNTLRQKIYSRPQENWNIADMAQMMLLSRAYFQRLYKQNFGVSAMSDVIAARIAMAKNCWQTGRIPLRRSPNSAAITARSTSCSSSKRKPA